MTATKSANQKAAAAFHPSRSVEVGGETFHLAVPSEKAEADVIRALKAVQAIKKGQADTAESAMLFRRFDFTQLRAVLPDVDDESIRLLARANVDLVPLYDAAKRLLGLTTSTDGDGGAAGPPDPS